jgi:hypothetical protein
MPTVNFSELANATLTTNMNYLQPNGFKLVIDRTNYPNLEFFAQSIIHPSMNLPATEVAYRSINNVPFAGDKMDFGELTATIIMDEEMKAYSEMYDWLKRILETPARTARSILDGNRDTHEADLTISVLSSSNNQTKQIRYIDAIPTGIGDVIFEATVGDVTYITFPVTFRFTYFTLV